MWAHTSFLRKGYIKWRGDKELPEEAPAQDTLRRSKNHAILGRRTGGSGRSYALEAVAVVHECNQPHEGTGNAVAYIRDTEMQFSEFETVEILRRQQERVVLYDHRSFSRGTLLPEEALIEVTVRPYVGIGNRRRIKAIRPLTTSWRRIAEDSITTIGRRGSVSHNMRVCETYRMDR